MLKCKSNPLSFEILGTGDVYFDKENAVASFKKGQFPYLLNCLPL